MEITEQNEFFLSKYELVGTPLKDDSKSFVTRVESQMDNTKSGIFKIYKNRDISGIYKQLKALTYPYWPAIYDVRYFEPDTYVVEEELSGCTLRDALESRAKSYTISQVVSFAMYMCESLKFLHNLNPAIVHRDIKPENIFLPNNDINKPMLIDFDAAREYDSDTDRDTVFIATRGYAPPEQYGMMQTDNRSDIYALGVVMHEMLTGELLNKLKISDKLRKKSEAIAEIVEKCVKPDPDDRFQRVEDLISDLSQIKNISSNATTEKKTESTPENEKSGEALSVPENKLNIYNTVGVVVGVLALIGGWLWYDSFLLAGAVASYIILLFIDMRVKGGFELIRTLSAFICPIFLGIYLWGNASDVVNLADFWKYSLIILFISIVMVSVAAGFKVDKKGGSITRVIFMYLPFIVLGSVLALFSVKIIYGTFGWNYVLSIIIGEVLYAIPVVMGVGCVFPDNL